MINCCMCVTVTRSDSYYVSQQNPGHNNDQQKKYGGNMKQTAEFEFVPSFLNIGIPLNNTTYIVTILLAVVSVAFKFVD